MPGHLSFLQDWEGIVAGAQKAGCLGEPGQPPLSPISSFPQVQLKLRPNPVPGL